MASALYDAARESYLLGDLAWDTDDVRAILIDTGLYSVDLATHDFLDDVAGGAARVATSSSLTSKTTTDGTADAADVTFSSVTGNTVEAIILYKHTGTESTSNLIAYIDGLSITPDGSDITIQWDDGANKIFTL